MLLMRVSRKTCTKNAFTLMEVLVTVVIVSLVLTSAYSVVSSTISAKVLVEQQMKSSRVGPAILNVLALDLRGAVPLLTGREFFIGGNGDPNELNGAVIRLTTSRQPAFVQTKARNTLVQVTYYLKPNGPDQPSGLYSLYRGERTIQGEGGNFRLLYDRVRRLSLQYYPPVGDPQDHWTTNLQIVPNAVELEIEIESESDEKRQLDELTHVYGDDDKDTAVYKYATIVTLPSAGTLSEEIVIGDDEEDEEKDNEDEEADDGETGGEGSGGSEDSGGGYRKSLQRSLSRKRSRSRRNQSSPDFSNRATSSFGPAWQKLFGGTGGMGDGGPQ